MSSNQGSVDVNVNYLNGTTLPREGHLHCETSTTHYNILSMCIDNGARYRKMSKILDNVKRTRRCRIVNKKIKKINFKKRSRWAGLFTLHRHSDLDVLHYLKGRLGVGEEGHRHLHFGMPYCLKGCLHVGEECLADDVLLVVGQEGPHFPDPDVLYYNLKSYLGVGEGGLQRLDFGVPACLKSHLGVGEEDHRSWPENRSHMACSGEAWDGITHLGIEHPFHALCAHHPGSSMHLAVVMALPAPYPHFHTIRVCSCQRLGHSHSRSTRLKHTWESSDCQRGMVE